MKKVKKPIPRNLRKGIPLTIRPGHTVRLEFTLEPLTVYTGLALFYAMAEALSIPHSLDEHVRVKKRESGYPESEHILALAANAFVGGDFLEDLEALREDAAIKKVIGREEIPDPTTAGDFCRRFSIGQIAQMEKAFAEIRQNVYTQRPQVKTWTVHVDAKVHEVYGKQKQGAARAYNGVYSLQPMYAFVHETDELAYVRLRPGNTHPGDKAVPFLRHLKRQIPPSVTEVNICSDSAFYNKEVVAFCERMGWGFTITADQTAPLMQKVLALEEDDWQVDPEDPSVAYAEVSYQPVGWPRPYRYLVRRKREKEIRRKRGKEKGGQSTLFDLFSYQIVVTNRAGEIRTLLEIHDQKGTTEKRIGQFTSEFLSHLPLGEFMANWVYLLCAQLGYNLSLWIRDLVLPESYRKRYIKRIRRCVGLIAAKVVQGGRQIRLKVSVLHRWWKDFVHAWQAIPTLSVAMDGG